MDKSIAKVGENPRDRDGSSGSILGYSGVLSCVVLSGGLCLGLCQLLSTKTGHQ